MVESIQTPQQHSVRCAGRGRDARRSILWPAKGHDDYTWWYTFKPCSSDAELHHAGVVKIKTAHLASFRPGSASIKSLPIPPPPSFFLPRFFFSWVTEINCWARRGGGFGFVVDTACGKRCSEKKTNNKHRIESGLLPRSRGIEIERWRSVCTPPRERTYRTHLHAVQQYTFFLTERGTDCCGKEDFSSVR